MPLTLEELDKPMFSFSELLALSGVKRGAVEGYFQRGVVKLSSPNPGRGSHRRYTVRELAKVCAAAFLSRLQVAPKVIDGLVNETPGVIDLSLLTDEELAEIKTNRAAHSLPEHFTPEEMKPRRALLDRFFDEVVSGQELGLHRVVLSPVSLHPSPDFYRWGWPDPSRLVEAMRDCDTVAYIVLDCDLLLSQCMKRVERFLAAKGVEE